MNNLVVAVNVSNESRNGSNTVYLERFLSCLKPEEIPNYTILVCKEGYEILYPLFPELKYELYEISPYFYSLLRFDISLKEAIRFREYVNKHRYDCVFISHFFAFFTRYKFNCKKVVVIHDIIPLHGKKHSFFEFKEYLFFKHYVKCQLKTSDNIIAISDYVKDDIVNTFKFKNADKIITIRNSIVTCQNTKQPQNFNESKYILFVGRPVSYKGFMTALKAFENLTVKGYKLVFVCRGIGYWKDVVEPYINANKLNDDIIHLEGVSDENLTWLYQNASLFITPSEHEGFGYTPIEAAINRCPVISSECDSLPEVTMGLVYYYHPTTDYLALAHRMADVLNNPPSDEQLSSISNRLISEYSPQKQADRIKQVLNNKI